MVNKYIVYKDNYGIHRAVLFDGGTSHDFVGELLNNNLNLELVSAGFWYIDKDGKYIAYGKSISLNMSSRPIEDTVLLNEHYNSELVL